MIAFVFSVVATGFTTYAQQVTTDPSGAQVSTDPTPPRNTQSGDSKLQNPLNVDSIEALLLLIVDIAIYIGTAFAILAIIFVGFKFVMAQGKPEKISEAKMWFFYIIIGLAVLISSKVIVEIVKNTLVESGVVERNIF